MTQYYATTNWHALTMASSDPAVDAGGGVILAEIVTGDKALLHESGWRLNAIVGHRLGICQATG